MSRIFVGANRRLGREMSYGVSDSVEGREKRASQLHGSDRIHRRSLFGCATTNSASRQEVRKDQSPFQDGILCAAQRLIQLRKLRDYDAWFALNRTPRGESPLVTARN